MIIEVVKNERFRFWLAPEDFRFEALKLVQWMNTVIPVSERCFTRETGIWRIDAKHRDAVIEQMMETIVPSRAQLVPVEDLEAVMPKRTHPGSDPRPSDQSHSSEEGNVEEVA